MSTSACTCKLNVSAKAMSLVGKKDSKMFKADGTTTCSNKDFSVGNFVVNTVDSIFMNVPSMLGLWEKAGFQGPQKVDESGLEAIQAKNDQLEKMFNTCQFQIVNCRMQQNLDFMMKNLELTESVNKITNEVQDQLIEKNMSLTYYSIAVGTLAIMYIMAMPTPPPKF